MYGIIITVVLFSFARIAVDPVAMAADGVVDITAQTGLASVTPSEGDMPVFAYRGGLAVVPSKHGRAWAVMVRQGVGSGARFSRVFTVLPDKEDGHGCTAADITNPSLTGRDGLIDLLCTKGACQGTCGRPYNKELWVQLPGGGFINLAQQAGITNPHARGRDSTVAAADDGRVVLALANEDSARYPAQSIDRAYLATGGTFTELPLYNATGTARTNSASTCVVAVPRGRSLPDLLFCENETVMAYRHDGGRYRLTNAYGTFRARDLLVADIDGNGKPDVLALGKTRLQLRRDGGAVSTLLATKDAHGLAVGDMNCDRKRDILVVQSKGAQNNHILLLNNGNGLSYRQGTFPHPTSGSGDTATYIPDWDGAGQAAMLVTHGLSTSGPTLFVAASCRG